MSWLKKARCSLFWYKPNEQSAEDSNTNNVKPNDTVLGKFPYDMLPRTNDHHFESVVERPSSPLNDHELGAKLLDDSARSCGSFEDGMGKTSTSWRKYVMLYKWINISINFSK